MTRETVIQQQVADYIVMRYPDALFHSDFGSGVKLTARQAIVQKRQNGGRRGWPDLFIAEACFDRDKDHRIIGRNYYGLFLELKREDARVFKRNGELVADEHIREQARVLSDLRLRGYRAEFACGFDEAKKIIDEYLGS